MNMKINLNKMFQNYQNGEYIYPESLIRDYDLEVSKEDLINKLKEHNNLEVKYKVICWNCQRRQPVLYKEEIYKAEFCEWCDERIAKKEKELLNKSELIFIKKGD